MKNIPDTITLTLDAYVHLTRQNKELLEVLKMVMSWIDNWSPSFTEEEEWDNDVKIIRYTIAGCEK